MQTKNLIFTADDLGRSEEQNRGILKAFRNGIITSSCLMCNFPYFELAIEEIIPQCKGIGIGVHLDIIEGKSLLNKTAKSLLCDINGNYKNNFVEIVYMAKDKKFLQEAEAEFRSQIEKTLSKTSVDHINSHVHTHAIPQIFELVCKLANEYHIPFVRTQFEKSYMIKSASKHLNFIYPVNLIKVGILNTFSIKNKNIAKQYGINTNDYFTGVRYTSFMDKDTVVEGLKVIPDDSTTEVLIHPYYFENCKKNEINKFGEYLLTQSPNLKNQIENLGFKLCTFSDLSRKKIPE